MSKKHVAALKEKPEDSTGSVILKWGKVATRVTAISATITGAFAALFSSSSLASGVALTAAGAGTLAAAEKLPEESYVKTKHVPPRPTLNMGRATLEPDLLEPEKIEGPSTKGTYQQHFPRVPASYDRPKSLTQPIMDIDGTTL